MSCSTTSLLAGTITTTTKNTLTIDDPYIFTETVPTTPPTLFSNSQKSKIRFETRPQQKQQQQQIAQTAPTTIVAGGGGGGGVALRATVQKLQTNNNRDNFYLKGRNYVAQTQTQTSAENFIKYTPTQTLQLLQQQQQTTTAQQNNNVFIHQQQPTAVLGVLNTNNIKKYEKKITTTATAKQTPQLRQQKQTQHVFAAQNENLIDKSQTTQPPQQQTKLLSTTPPPLLLPHTPSLWQTPLLLESTPTAAAATPTTATSKSQTTPPASVRITLAPRTASQQLTKPALPTAATALITPPVAPVVGGVTTTTLAPGSVAPLHLLMSSAAPLPPSNFHHTTLAEHLQKLQCLKKPKKADTQPTAAAAMPATAKQTLQPPAVIPTAATLMTASPKQNQKHSTIANANDLNEIPVNVIYRAATMTPKTATPPLTSLPARAPSASPAEPTAAKIKNSTPLPPPPAPLLLNRPTNVGNVSKATVPIATQMIPQMSTTSPHTVVTQKAAKKLTTPKQKPAKASKRRAAVVPLSPHSHSPPKAQKRFRKSNVFPVLLNECERVALPMLLPNIPLSTKAVAIVKRPLNEFAQFDSTLYAADDDNELPFCVQRHWFTLHHQQQQQHQRKSQLSGGCRGREERISNYKSLLRRQAMQLLATRSLQRLPFNVARKRLICVDALLRKYRDHNKIASSPNKKCEIEFCKNVALTMTTLCQQHMAKNSKQSIFVLCSAKNVAENFVQQQQQAATTTTTTCNVPVLNIQKQHTPPLCQRHLSKLQQQQQRRLNNIVGGSEAKVSTAATNRKRKSNTAAAAAAVVKQNTTTPTGLAVDATTTLLQSSSRQHDNSRKINMQRKNSTTSLESIASNSQSSFGSVSTAAAATTNLTASHMISPPALAPLSYNTTTIDLQQQTQRAFPAGIIDPVAEQEINKLVAQFAMAAAAKSAANGSCVNNNNNNQLNSFNFMLNTNSNSNLTSSGVGGGSSSSLPSSSTADELLTQDMLSNCENSISAYASSSEDTGLGELSESELMAVSSSLAENIAAHGDDDAAATASAIVNGFANIGGNGGGAVNGIVGSAFNDDDVIADEIPLGDARLLEETDLVNVFGTLPVNLNELFNAVVQQDEREEVERALEIADKHLRSLQQTIGSETDFLADLLNVNDDILNVGDDEDVDVDICSKMEIVSSVLPPNESLEAAALYLENADKILSDSSNNIGNVNGVNGGSAANITMPSNCANNNATNNAGGGIIDIRGLLQT